MTGFGASPMQRLVELIVLCVLSVALAAPASAQVRAPEAAQSSAAREGDHDVASLGDFYSKVWARGAAGIEVPLRVLQGTQLKEITLRSIDRLEYFRSKPTY